MSLAFNDTTNFKGIIQIIEKEIEKERGFISGNTNRLKETTADVNLAWDDYVYLALKASGTWQFDDSNFTDYPIIKTAITQGQRDYTFTTDEGSNLILDVHKVLIRPSASATDYVEIYPIDQQTKDHGADITSENTAQGVPTYYDKTANGIIFDRIPSYTRSEGLKVLINREPSYFTSSDTTKKPGCPGIHHRYFALKAALDYARRHGLASYARLREEVVSFEGDEEKGITGSIERYFSRRARDERPRLIPRLSPFV